jgi:hypothetical protein
MMRAGPLETRVDLARMIVQRLERLSADSAWAHISSGYRGSLLKWLDRYEREGAANSPADQRQLLEFLIDKGLELLANAARELGDPSLVSNLPKPVVDAADISG